MKKIKKIILYLITTSFLYSCGSLSDVGKSLRNEKTKTTDEFLVKKGEPLTLPPDYNNLPEPKSKNFSEENEEDNINKILKIPKKQAVKTGSSNVEQSIIDQIRK
mgnify:CR=1 FL=1